MLRKSSIVLLDEASASLDADADRLLQKTIRTEFKHATIITIAHRLSTIIDSDQIIVMDSGNVAEDGHPSELMKKENGKFRGMVEKLGSEQFEKLLSVAEGKTSLEEFNS